MSISSEIQRLSNAKSGIATAIRNKGVTVPYTTKLDGMAALIGNIQTRKPEQTKTATANGTVSPDSGYVLSSVTVSIPTYDGSVT